MFVNLHTLPAGQSMFTVYVTLDPEGTARSQMGVEEVDIVHAAGSGYSEVVNDGKDSLGERVVDTYGPEVRIVGVVDQSAGEVIYDAWNHPDPDFRESGPNDL